MAAVSSVPRTGHQTDEKYLHNLIGHHSEGRMRRHAQRIHDAVEAKRSDPYPAATPGPTQHHPGHPDDRSGDTVYPLTRHNQSKINYQIEAEANLLVVSM